MRPGNLCRIKAKYNYTNCSRVIKRSDTWGYVRREDGYEYTYLPVNDGTIVLIIDSDILIGQGDTDVVFVPNEGFVLCSRADMTLIK